MIGKHSDFHLSFFQIVGAWQDFTVVTKLIKNFKSLYGFGGRFLKIRDFCMDFEPYFKVHNLVSVRPQSVILGQMTNLNMIFHVVVSVYRLVKILKLAPIPWWISERLIVIVTASFLVAHNLTAVKGKRKLKETNSRQDKDFWIRPLQDTFTSGKNKIIKLWDTHAAKVRK